MDIPLPSYTFYKDYHRNHVNRVIHVVCIPMISWSICVFLPPFYGFLLTSFYAALYSYLFAVHLPHVEQEHFFRITAYLGSMWTSAVAFQFWTSYATIIAAGVFVLSWVMQFVGHYVYEGNRPALLDSLHQSLLMAPLFAYFELSDVVDARVSND